MARKPKTTISKENLRKIQAGARRSVDIENGIGVNRRHGVSVDKKKKQNKEWCRDKTKKD